MWSRIYFALLILFFPAFASAATLGFPTESVWLSNAKPVLGEKIRIYAVVYNGTESEAVGTLTFLVDGKENGSKDISLSSGESTVVASPWTATEGSHTFSARFQGSGESASAQVSETVVATVEAPPSAVEETLNSAKETGSQIAATSLPIISTVANKVFDTTEAIREAGVEYFEQKIASNNSPGETSNVEGFETPTATEVRPAKSMLSSVGQTASAAALFTLRSLWLFYPLLVGFLLLIARWLYRWVTRPRF